MFAVTSPELVLQAFGTNNALRLLFPNAFLDAYNVSFLLVAVFVFAFLVGSVPWGVVIGKLFFKQDVRKSGSGNIGTTNVLRTVGKRGGAAVFLLDFGKGLLSGYIGILASGLLLASGYSWGLLAEAICFAGCIWGHMFCPWLKFKGGKGIAVAIGCLFFTFGVVPSLIELLVFAVIVITTRYVSAGSIAAAIIAPFIGLFVYWDNWFAFFLVMLSAISIIWAHRSNISRLRSGNESRIGEKKDKKEKSK